MRLVELDLRFAGPPRDAVPPCWVPGAPAPHEARDRYCKARQLHLQLAFVLLARERISRGSARAVSHADPEMLSRLALLRRGQRWVEQHALRAMRQYQFLIVSSALPLPTNSAGSAPCASAVTRATGCRPRTRPARQFVERGSKRNRDRSRRHENDARGAPCVEPLAGSPVRGGVVGQRDAGAAHRKTTQGTAPTSFGASLA